MVPHAIPAPNIIYTSLLLGQSWHVCRVIDGRAFFILALRLPKWARKKKGNYNDEAEVLTAFVYCSEQVGLNMCHKVKV